MTAVADVRARIDQFLADRGLAQRGASVVALTGDASDRRYFRVLVPNDATQVLAVHPGPIAFEQLPFVNVALLLEAMPVPVPRILAHSNELGIIALEDLGDVTLQAHLGAATPAEHAALYRQAVSLIETLQRRGNELAAPGYVPYGIAFDVEKLTWELNFFVKHYLEAYRGAAFDDAARAALSEEFSAIVEELAAEPRVLCHRDYHSRNLMLHDAQLYIIDFQDARMGPDTYDLVSLLRDSYVDLTDPQVDELIAFFLALRGRGTGAGGADAQRFRERFDLMALQRNLKALGTFGFQAATRANPVYIQYIPRTLMYARTNLERHPRFGRLRELLAGGTGLTALRLEAGLKTRGHDDSPAAWGCSSAVQPAGKITFIVGERRFGLSTHLFHDQRLTREHLAFVARHGFEAIEVFATRPHFDYRDDEAVTSLAGWLAETRLELHSMHAPIAEAVRRGEMVAPYSTASGDEGRRAAAVAEVKAALAVAARIPFRVLVLHLGVPASTRPPANDNQPAAARRSLEEIVDAARAVGVQVAVEVMPNSLSTPHSLVRLIEDESDELDGLGICLDYGHAHLMGDVGEAIEEVSGHLITTHVHDNRRRADDHLPPFAGSIDWDMAMMETQKIGYDGVLMFEVANTGDAAATLQRCADARDRLENTFVTF